MFWFLGDLYFAIHNAFRGEIGKGFSDLCVCYTQVNSAIAFETMPDFYIVSEIIQNRIPV